MADRIDLLKKKVFGIIQSIEKMSVKEKEVKPSPEFAEDYNRLRKMVLEEKKDLEDLLPPEVKIEEYSFGIQKSSQSFAEINSYCSQIFQLLT